MAINWPSPASNGDTYTYAGVTYTYSKASGEYGYWTVAGASGVFEIATSETINAGTDNTQLITPLGLAESEYNMTAATSDVINTGTDNTQYVTALGLAGSDYATMEFVTVTTSQNIEPNVRYSLDSSISGITLTLPASLNIGDTFYFSDAEGMLNENPVTIARNGHLILGLDEDFDQDINYTPLDLVYSGATQGVILA